MQGVQALGMRMVCNMCSSRTGGSKCSSGRRAVEDSLLQAGQVEGVDALGEGERRRYVPGHAHLPARRGFVENPRSGILLSSSSLHSNDCVPKCSF